MSNPSGAERLVASRETCERMRDADPWNEALAEWGEGPRTMKATADWANRWTHPLRTHSERQTIALSQAERHIVHLIDVCQHAGGRDWTAVQDAAAWLKKLRGEK